MTGFCRRVKIARDKVDGLPMAYLLKISHRYVRSSMIQKAMLLIRECGKDLNNCFDFR